MAANQNRRQTLDGSLPPGYNHLYCMPAGILVKLTYMVAVPFDVIHGMALPSAAPYVQLKTVAHSSAQHAGSDNGC